MNGQTAAMKTVGKAKVAAIFLSLGAASIEIGAALSLRGQSKTAEI